jgi:hypothetical protein
MLVRRTLLKWRSPALDVTRIEYISPEHQYLGIAHYLAAGRVRALKAEALHLANRTPEALGALKEAEALTQRTEERECFAELHRLRGVFLAFALTQPEPPRARCGVTTPKCANCSVREAAAMLARPGMSGS